MQVVSPLVNRNAVCSRADGLQLLQAINISFQQRSKMRSSFLGEEQLNGHLVLVAVLPKSALVPKISINELLLHL